MKSPNLEEKDPELDERMKHTTRPDGGTEVPTVIKKVAGGETPIQQPSAEAQDRDLQPDLNPAEREANRLDRENHAKSNPRPLPGE